MDEATFKEEVAFIRRAYAQRSGDLPKFVASHYDRIANEAEQRAFLDDFIAGSEKRKDYWDAVNLIARRQLRKGNALPTLLANWITDVLEDQSFRRQKKKTRPRPAKGRRNVVHDQNVCLAMENLTARGFQATRRGREPRACAEGGSACDVVGAAFGLNYKNTERIWESGKPPTAS